MAETTALQAKMKLDTTEVKRTGTLEKGYKVTGISGTGTLKLNKVTSYFIKKISENWPSVIQPVAFFMPTSVR
jgi:hypothetical protein